ncbi:Protein kinase-like domain superfamily [Fusarium oxysporum f. sp. vasinfectum]|nr:Protein kinase-like domain superfamily [Fusarium oxysporum f. sp. vasinfectum]
MAPPLRRKRPFCLASPQVPRHAAIPFHTEKHPNTDYYACYNTNTSERKWIGQNRALAIRQLVTVQKLPATSRASFTDIGKLNRISHENVVRPDCFYHVDGELYIVYEFLYLDIFDLFPLQEAAVACIVKQTICGFRHLKDLEIFFGIDIIQINEYGVVKIVIDWNQDEFSVERSLHRANEEYLVAYLQELMAAMAQRCNDLPKTVSNFFIGSVLPDMGHDFIANVGGPEILRERVISAIRRKLLGGGIKPFTCDPSI